MPTIFTQRKDTPRHMPPKPGLHPHPVPPPPIPHETSPGEERWREEHPHRRPHDEPESPPEPRRTHSRGGQCVSDRC